MSTEQEQDKAIEVRDVTAIGEHWYKIAFFLAWKATKGTAPVRITLADMNAAMKDYQAITFREEGDALVLEVVSETEANRLQAEQGAIGTA